MIQIQVGSQASEKVVAGSVARAFISTVASCNKELVIIIRGQIPFCQEKKLAFPFVHQRFQNYLMVMG
jgi:hypothetical protein